MKPHEHVARRVADCLEQYLEEYGLELYRYPSGEMKGVQLSIYSGYSEIAILPTDNGPSCSLIVVERKG